MRGKHRSWNFPNCTVHGWIQNYDGKREIKCIICIILHASINHRIKANTQIVYIYYKQTKLTQLSYIYLFEMKWKYSKERNFGQKKSVNETWEVNVGLTLRLYIDVHTMKKREIIEDRIKRNRTLDWRLANSSMLSLCMWSRNSIKYKRERESWAWRGRGKPMGVGLYVIRGPTIRGFSQSYECLLFGFWDKRKCVGCKLGIFKVCLEH